MDTDVTGTAFAGLRRVRAGALAVALGLLPLGLLLHQPDPVLAAHQSARPPLSYATVVEVQMLFSELGYPLSPHERPGHMSVATRGAVSYFQRKYHLPVTSYPDARTLTEMRRVAAALRRQTEGASPKHDIVERALGSNPPLLSIAVVLAVVLGALALRPGLRPRRRRRYTSPSAAPETIEVTPEES